MTIDNDILRAFFHDVDNSERGIYVICRTQEESDTFLDAISWHGYLHSRGGDWQEDSVNILHHVWPNDRDLSCIRDILEENCFWLVKDGCAVDFSFFLAPEEPDIDIEAEGDNPSAFDLI